MSTNLQDGEYVVSAKGRRWLERGHPWVYRDDIQRGFVEHVTPGTVIAVLDPKGKRIGWALASPASRIAARIVSREETQPDREFWKKRITHAFEYRAKLGYLEPDGACRLIAGDSEGFPGWVVDRYADVLVLQSGTASADAMRTMWVELLLECSPVPVRAILDRSDAAVRKHERLLPRVEFVHGDINGEIEGTVAVREGELCYEVDVEHGHKTGHYLDQRENRIAATSDCAGKVVLDAFSYDGLFGIRAALSGAKDVLCLDQSAEAGERVLRNAERNGVADRVRFEKVDCMTDLRRRVSATTRYDLVACDPPPFARNRRAASGAERGYVELNRRALEILAPGGLLVTSSCSHNVKAADYVQFLARASSMANRTTFIESLRGAALDHRVLLALPESSYLKCAFLRAE